MHTHDSVQWAVLTVLATIDLRFRDHWLTSMPLFHVAALVPMVWCVYRGLTIVMMRDFDPQRIWEVFRDEQVTNCIAVPAMLNFMLPTNRPELRESLVLRWMLSGASPVPVSLVPHPGISDAAVVGMASAKWGESRAVFIDAMPRTPTGKTLKHKLREQFSFDAPE